MQDISYNFTLMNDTQTIAEQREIIPEHFNVKAQIILCHMTTTPRTNVFLLGVTSIFRDHYRSMDTYCNYEPSFREIKLCTHPKPQKSLNLHIHFRAANHKYQEHSSACQSCLVELQQIQFLYKLDKC
jgi:hypothetical protein